MGKSGSNSITRTLLVLTFAGLAAAFSEVTAGPGFLDASFGNGGHVITSFAGSNMHGDTNSRDLAIQSDGKIVVAGTLNNAGLVRIIVVRYNRDGTLDTTFGSGGRVVTNFDFYSYATGVAIQPDGRIVVVGSHYKPTLRAEEYVVVRFDTDGGYDSSFGTDGVQRIQMGGGAEDIALQPDGKIVIVGLSDNGSAIIRLDQNGSFDTTFDGDGKVLFTGSASRVELQKDGKIVVAGNILDRFNMDGSLDETFGEDSAANFFGSYDDIAIQADGKIVATSTVTDTVDEEYYFRVAYVVRYHGTGALDASFGTRGLVRMVTTTGGFLSLVIQSNGKIVTGGGGPTLARFSTDGSLEGIRTDQMAYWSYFNSLALQPDGKIVAGGGSFDEEFSTAADFLVARYSPDDLVISGRLVTPSGMGLRNATVILRDTSGARRSVITSALGFYRFDDVRFGDIVTIAVASRRYRFEPVTRTINEDLSDLDFMGLE